MECSIDECTNPSRTRTWCQKHYMRWFNYGRTTLLPKQSLDERFWAKVEKTDGCWLWTGATSNGRGRFNTGEWDGWKRSAPAHRVAYQLVIGPIPEGLEIDHLCNNPICVRPDHLEPVTRSENARRAAQDIHVSPMTGHRGCDTCKAFFSPEHYQTFRKSVPRIHS